MHPEDKKTSHSSLALVAYYTDPALNRLWASRDNGVWLLTQRMSEDLLAIKMINRVRWLSEQEQTVCVYNSRMRGARRQPRFPGAGMRLE
jgi:hypothetical protein